MKAIPKKKKNFIMPSALLGGNTSTVFTTGIEYEVVRIDGNKVILKHSDKYDTSNYQFDFQEVSIVP